MVKIGLAEFPNVTSGDFNLTPYFICNDIHASLIVTP